MTTDDILSNVLLSKEEACKLLRCSMRHLENTVNDGLMPKPIRIGKSPRFRRDELLKWIEDGCPAIEQK